MRRLSTAIAISVLAITLSACGSTDDTTAKPTPSATTSGAPGALPPKPEGPQRAALLAALKAVNPALTADEDKAVSNARNQCSTITGGGNSQSTAKARFSTSEHEITDAEAQAINAALKATLCA